MASSSCSSSFTNPPAKYDVFLSFRDEYTQHNFTSHLHAALCRRSIQVFTDNEPNRGDGISSSLLNAIEISKISVIIFSKDYGSSKCCLEELVQILDCKKMYGQIVIPIFYYVDPSNVRHQTGTFGDGFAKLEERFRERLETLQRWKIALTKAANLSGWPTNDQTPEAVLIEEIVKDILKRLNEMSTSDNKDLVGAEFTIQKVESLLRIGSSGVCAVGIWGIGGVGKTTISRAVFNKHLNQFEGFYFAENVREESEKSDGLTYLRCELLSTILEDRHPNIGHFLTKERLGRKKVFIVFDDVTSFQQIKKLIENPKCLGSGSRIIITTRDKQVLQNIGVDHIYELKGLFDQEALQLFSHFAFKQNFPAEDYIELSHNIVTYVKGIPLALKVLGSFLFRRTKEEWESALNKLEVTPHKDIQKVLKISYDGLDDEEKNIFLDMACFFKGEDRDLVIGIMDECGFSTEIGLSVLIDKFLITISNNKIKMHDLLQEMGKEIVRQESIRDPGKRSRLVHPKDICHVLTKNVGTKAIEGICLDMSKVRDISLNPHAFEKMHNLRFLKFYSSHFGENMNKVHGFQGLKAMFTQLRYLFWHSYPLKSLPSIFSPESLVALDMPRSNVEQLWAGVQNVVSLKHINLNHSKRLIKAPDLSLAKNLEILNLEGCTSMLETHTSLQYLNKLAVLNLRYCKSLCNIPSGIYSESLRKVILSGCSNLNTVPRISCNIEELYLDGTAIEELPSSIDNLSKLVTLNLHTCSRLKSLPSNIGKLKSLQYLYLTCCSNLEAVPEFSCTLKELYLDGSGITELRSSIEYLSRLKTLNLLNCSRLENLPSLCKLSSLVFLKLSGCSNLKKIPNLSCNIENLYLGGTAIQELSTSIECLSKLVTLDLQNCSRLESLPSGIGKLKSLKSLHLSGCSKLERLPDSIGNLEALNHLEAKGIGISEIPSSIVYLNNLRLLSFEGCKVQEQGSILLPPLSGLGSLTRLNLSGCSITELPSSLGYLTSLRDLYLGSNNFESIPAGIINLSKLSWLDICYCDMLKSIPQLPSSLQRLEGRSCSSLEVLSGLSSVSSSSKWNYERVNFINCFKLDQNALQDIVKYVLLKIQRSATEPFGNGSHGFMCFPGSEIPEWFSFQSMGSFIELPLGSLNRNLVGMALCTVVSFQHHADKGQDLVVKCELHLKGNDGQYKKVADASLSAWSFIESDHVLLGYDCNMFIPVPGLYGVPELFYDSEVFLQFYVEDSQCTRLDCYVVKRCGVRLMYSQVCGQLNEESNFNSEEKEEERQPKRLKP